MKHAEFKTIARGHQIDFKVNDPEIDIAADRFLSVLFGRMVRNIRLK